MPRMQTETFGAGDHTWLGSSHGIWECRTEVLDISAFTEADHYPDGYIPSGTPCALVGDKLVPYESAEATTTGDGVLAGFLFSDQPVVGTNDFGVPLLDHGRIKSANVPQGVDAFTAPVDPLKRVATTFVFI